jgi:hypothetical protein
LEPPVATPPIPASDAKFTGTGFAPPPAILLDYMYGVAAYKCWGAGQMDDLMQDRFLKHYKSIPMPLSLSSSDSSNSGDHSRGSNSRPYRRRHHRPDISPEMERAMQDLFLLSMFLKGTTPEAVAAERLLLVHVRYSCRARCVL